MKNIILLALIFAMLGLTTSCIKGGSLIPDATRAISSDDKNSDNTPDVDPTDETPTDPGNGNNDIEGCGDVIGEICKGGYDASSNKKKIPSKIIFMAAAGDSIPAADQASMSNDIINVANQNLAIDGHKLIQFETAQHSFEIAPAMSTIRNDSEYMVQNYGSTSHFVLIIVKGFMPPSGGTIGYSPGLRIDWKSKQSIVVMDYNYIKNHQYGATVIVHELFHGLGAPHTTDINGSCDNSFKAGLTIFKDMKNGDGLAACYGQQYAQLHGTPVLDAQARNMAYDFSIYIEEGANFRGIKAVQGHNWDTRTMMFYSASGYSLFNNTDSAFNGAYSNILHVYYDSYLK